MSTATNHDDIEIVVLLYAPNDKYPFWKIATIGCSEIEHKLKSKTVYNEYVIFVNKEENLETNISLRNWYYDMLLVPDGFARDLGNRRAAKTPPDKISRLCACRVGFHAQLLRLALLRLRSKGNSPCNGILSV